MTDCSPLHQAILQGNAETAVATTRVLLDVGAEPLQLVTDAIGPAMQEAGQLFQDGEYFVPELLMAARATKSVFELLRPILAKQGVAPVGRVVLGTVQGDLHDIGKNLVAAMLEGGGFEVVDLGVDVTPEKFVAAIKEKAPSLVGLSALLTTTLPAMKKTIDALASSQVRGNVKVMVGGAPVTQGFADSVGADGYAADASRAVELARQLVAG
jgi:5-methyltetrahydrofolate--homocysteine methyltransferase